MGEAEGRREVVPETYTHGHQEPVLRSHRWRTAANSAGYLLDHLRPGDALQAVAYGVATAPELAEVADGWRAWALDPGATFTVVHGELLATV